MAVQPVMAGWPVARVVPVTEADPQLAEVQGAVVALRPAVPGILPEEWKTTMPTGPVSRMPPTARAQEIQRLCPEARVAPAEVLTSILPEVTAAHQGPYAVASPTGLPPAETTPVQATGRPEAIAIEVVVLRDLTDLILPVVVPDQDPTVLAQVADRAVDLTRRAEAEALPVALLRPLADHPEAAVVQSVAVQVAAAGLPVEADRPEVAVAQEEEEAETKIRSSKNSVEMSAKFKLNLFSLLMVCLVSSASAQGPFGYYNDALLFSRTNFGGTARMQAIGGAQVSLGGDQSSATSNPAGLGFYNKSEFAFTPALNFHNADASYFGDNTSSFRTNFNFAHLGVVLNYSQPNTTDHKFRGGSFAITFNRTNNFQSEVEYQGLNSNNSITDSFVENAGTLDPSLLGGFEAVAYNQFLIDRTDGFAVLDNGLVTLVEDDPAYGGYTSLVGNFYGSLPRQSESIRTRGGQNQINIAWGGNYMDRLYFGGGLGIATVDYRRTRTYVEDNFTFDDGNPDDILTNLTIEDELTVTGAGVNLTLGLIARPLDFMTLGVSYVSPTFYALEEESSFDFTTVWNEFYAYQLPDDTVSLGFISQQSDLFTSNYNLRTPAKLNFGTTIFLGKQGFLTGDVEFVDYSTAEIRTNDFQERADNQEILALYNSVVNYRLGAEFRFDAIRLRGGYAYQADPFKNPNIDRSVQNLSFGLGYRNKDYFLDFTIVNSRTNNQFSPYFTFDDTPVAEVEQVTTNALLTFGVNF